MKKNAEALKNFISEHFYIDKNDLIIKNNGGRTYLEVFTVLLLGDVLVEVYSITLRGGVITKEAGVYITNEINGNVIYSLYLLGL
jgi:hypothetical protein